MKNKKSINIGDNLKESILIINYAMDKNDPIFSHQFEAVEEISKYFQEVYVITGRLRSYSTSKNVIIYPTNWEENSNKNNILNFFRIYLKIMKEKNPTNIFSHMTAVQSSLICLHTWLNRKKHYLWYAHKSNNKFLLFSYFFLTGFITSTKGSFPFKTKKLSVIGQAINAENFLKVVERNYDFADKKLIRLVHLGRFDKSKDIESLIECALKSQTINRKFELTQIGQPSNSQNLSHFKEITNKYKRQIESGEINITPNISRNQVPLELSKYDIFLHAFEGSLDKSIMEATFLEMPVVTINKEYISEFGQWNRSINENSNTNLEDELNSLLSLNVKSIEDEIQIRRLKAFKKHSLKNWAARISSLY